MTKECNHPRRLVPVSWLYADAEGRCEIWIPHPTSVLRPPAELFFPAVSKLLPAHVSPELRPRDLSGKWGNLTAVDALPEIVVTWHEYTFIFRVLEMRGYRK